MKTFLAATLLVVVTLVAARPCVAQRPKRPTTLEGHSDAVKSLTFSPDGKMLASASDDGTIKLWEVISGKLRATAQNEIRQDYFVAFSPDGKLLATTARFETFNLWDVTTGQKKAKFYPDLVTSVAFSNDGALMAVGGRHNPLTLWDMKTGLEKAALKGHDEPVQSVVFNNDGSVLASGSWSGRTKSVQAVTIANRRLVADSIPHYGTIKVWDVPTGKTKATIEVESFPRTLSITPDGRFLALGSKDGTIELWDVATGRLKPPVKSHSFRVLSFAFSPDGALLASGGMDRTSGLMQHLEPTIKLLDVKTGQEPLTLHGHTSSVFCVAFSPDGKLLASGDSDGRINLWQLPVTKKAE